MTISKQDRQLWITVAEGMVTQFLAAREQAAVDLKKAAEATAPAKRRATQSIK